MALIGVTGPGVMETSTTTGTGTYTLAGAVTGYQTVGAVLADGDTGYFGVIGVDANGNRNGDGWEEIYGTYTAAGTTLARTTVIKSSNSNNAVNWSAGTRRVFLLDLPSKAKGINSLAINLPLTGHKFVRVQAVNVNTGDNDLYTVPAGKRAFVLSLQAYNNSAGNITAKCQVKISGTYYRISSDSTLSTGTAVTMLVAMVLEPGDVLSVNTATTNGFNCVGQAIEFDSTVPFYSPRLLSLAVGDTTLYTCPTGKTAYVLSATGNVIVWGASGAASVIGDASGSSVIFHVVPSGQSPGVNYKVAATVSVGANGRGAQNLPASLAAGDFINVNVSANTPPIAWTNVLEIGN